jgi:biopolymer transport protein ExbD
MAIRRTHKIDAGFSLSSMTDLVFLLLIFFVIVSTMVSPFALTVDLPKGKPSTSKEPPKISVRLEVGGTATLNGRLVVPGGLEAAIAAEMQDKAATNAVVLHVAQDVPTGEMVAVLDMAKRNKWRIVLAASAQDPGTPPTAQQP